MADMTICPAVMAVSPGSSSCDLPSQSSRAGMLAVSPVLMWCRLR
ncbi:hypothetical protein SynBIOSE41_03455 [Synechococcus sp. BIOS-E4-1]|nr:hypothetical protein SynBIOSE41_03455 [Synechococcus sp. BIOS-E4-1]